MLCWQLALMHPLLHIQFFILKVFIKCSLVEVRIIFQFIYRSNSQKYLRVPRGGTMQYFIFCPKVSIGSSLPQIMFSILKEILYSLLFLIGTFGVLFFGVFLIVGFLVVFVVVVCFICSVLGNHILRLGICFLIDLVTKVFSSFTSVFHFMTYKYCIQEPLPHRTLNTSN